MPGPRLDLSPPRLDDLTPEARRTLQASVDTLHAALTKLSGGAGFCEDRGYGWSLESEKGYRETIEAAFDSCPVLKRLMHDSWVLLATGATIGDRPVALEELAITRVALAGRQVFEWRTGDSTAETQHVVTLGPVDVQVRTGPVASTRDGRPDMTGERRYSYEAFGEPAVWGANVEGIGDVIWPLSAVFARLRRYCFTCDACPSAAGSIGFAAENTRLESTSPLGPPTARAIDAATAARVQAALIGNDFRTLHALDPALVPAYCPACDHVYCPSHRTTCTGGDSDGCVCRSSAKEPGSA